MPLCDRGEDLINFSEGVTIDKAHRKLFPKPDVRT
jgi:hypothetical protein